MTKNYPKPSNWQDFQIFIKDLLIEKYGKFDIYGRNGQAQNGVDILGNYSNEIIGVQCKRLDSKLTIKIIEQEINKAETFVPKLTKYIIATTDLRDTHLQKKVLDINLSRKLQSLFEIEIWFWDSIEDEINGNINIWTKYYEDIFSRFDTQHKELHIVDTILNAFSRPAFATPFGLENNIHDFLQAIKDTQEFMNTGKLKSRKGEYIVGSFSYKQLKEIEDVNNGNDICKYLQEIRDLTTAGIKNGSIKNCKPDCICVSDRQVEHELNRLRKELLTSLNYILKRHKMNEIMIRY